ncbi:MAG: hypothetical protein M3409_09220 [Gemmatimonadota bacterium]|nr:hypothetical protein [Gemmatimonadota bacterium]
MMHRHFGVPEKHQPKQTGEDEFGIACDTCLEKIVVDGPSSCSQEGWVRDDNGVCGPPQSDGPPSGGGGDGGGDGGDGGGSGWEGGGDGCDPSKVIGGCEPPPYISPFGDDVLPQTEPDCTKPQTHPGAITWCLSRDVRSDERMKAESAFARMDSRGEACKKLADEGRRLLASDRIKTYTYENSNGASGWGGGGYGITIQETWFSHYFNTPTNESPPRNLDMALAHELYHEMNPTHTHGPGEFYPTDRQCSGL